VKNIKKPAVALVYLLINLFLPNINLLKAVEEKFGGFSSNMFNFL
jgi:hypothetical protein